MKNYQAATAKLIDILLIEDNVCDAELTRYVFENSPLTNKLHVVADGNAALDYIYMRGNYKNSERPDVILLDMNIPEKDGSEIVRILHSDPATRDIPIIALTGDMMNGNFINEDDATLTPCIAKPLTLPSFMQAVKAMEQSWSDLNALSSRLGDEKTKMAS